MKTILTIILIIIVVVFLFTSAFYLWILDWITTNVTTVRSDFIEFIPLDLRVFIYLIFLAIMIWLAYTFIKD